MASERIEVVADYAYLEAQDMVKVTYNHECGETED